MRCTVSADSYPKISLNESGRIASVLQNIAIILTTMQGSVPLYRDFGLSWEFVDRPVEVAKVLLIVRVKEAIEKYEPRAKFLSVTFDDSEPSRLIPVVEVDIVDE